MKAREKFIDSSKAEVGYPESGTNITKYWTYFDSTIWQWYNTKKQGAEWCQGFLAYLICRQLGAAEALKFLGIPSVKDNCSAGVPYFWNYLVNKGYKVDKAAGKEGDIIFFNNKKHVGMIEYVDGNYYHTIEGNKNNKVDRGTYAKTDSYVYGICSLPWENYDEPEPQKVTVELDVLTKGMKSGQVQTIQMLLNEIGFRDQDGKRLATDGVFGDRTKYALTNYQKARGLTVTGICDFETWNRILK